MREIRGKKAVESTMGVLDRLSLPCPQIHQYFNTRDGGVIVPLARLGMIVRSIPLERAIIFDHPIFLRALYAQIVGDNFVSVEAGIDSPVSSDDRGKFLDGLLEGGLYCTDTGRANLGYIPGSYKQQIVILDKDASTVVISGNARQSLANSVASVRALLDDYANFLEVEDFQCQYDDLRSALAEVMAGEATNPLTLRGCFKLAQELVANKLLSRSFTHSLDLNSASRSYNDAIYDHEPFKELCAKTA